MELVTELDGMELLPEWAILSLDQRQYRDRCESEKHDNNKIYTTRNN